MERCIALNDAAMCESVPLISVFNPGITQSDRYIFMSIWTGERHHYSTFGRTMVRFDKEMSHTTSLFCQCSKARRGCIHKSIAKWYLLQTCPQLFKTDKCETTCKNDEHSDDEDFTVNDGDNDLERKPLKCYESSEVMEKVKEQCEYTGGRSGYH